MLDEILKNDGNNIFSDDPPEGHIERFTAKLNTSLHKSKKQWLAGYYSVAASIAVLIATAAIMIISLSNNNSETELLCEVNPEYCETEIFFQNEIDARMKELVEKDNFEKNVLNDLKEIDLSFEMLKNDLRQNPEDERILHAAINTYQVKLDLLDEILSHVE